VKRRPRLKGLGADISYVEGEESDEHSIYRYLTRGVLFA